MPIYKQVEICSCRDVYISNKDIIEDLEEKDAQIIIEGLLKKFPNLVDNIILFTKKTGKLYPKGLQDQFEQKYKKENKLITSF